MNRLTEKQRRFCEAFAANGGNATGAARDAGYAKPDPEGARLLGNARIQAEIETMRKQKTDKAIASRQERQAFWTKIMRDSREEMKDRLKASEILGKSHGDFVNRIEHSGPGGGPIAGEMSDAQLLAIVRMSPEARRERIERLRKIKGDAAPA